LQVCTFNICCIVILLLRFIVTHPHGYTQLTTTTGYSACSPIRIVRNEFVGCCHRFLLAFCFYFFVLSVLSSRLPPNRCLPKTWRVYNMRSGPLYYLLLLLLYYTMRRCVLLLQTSSPPAECRPMATVWRCDERCCEEKGT